MTCVPVVTIFLTKGSLTGFALLFSIKGSCQRAASPQALNMHTASEIQLARFIKETVPDAAVKAYLKEVWLLYYVSISS
jgi:hypothetical protein